MSRPLLGLPYTPRAERTWGGSCRWLGSYFAPASPIPGDPVTKRSRALEGGWGVGGVAREEGRREPGLGVGLGPSRSHHQTQGGQSQGYSGQRDLGTDGQTEGGPLRGVLPLPEPAQLLALHEVRCLAVADWGTPWGIEVRDPRA